MFTGVKYFYELKEVLTFPLKYKDLSPISRLAINIFSFDSPNMDRPIASTVVDLFDSKRRLRQGTWNLQLHLDKAADSNLNSQTPGLTDDPTTLEINNILRGIHKW
ncbi:MAG: hypothetical protein ACK521_11635 [bacterium]